MADWKPLANWKLFRLSDEDMRDDNEKRIFKAMRDSDVETLKKIITDFAGCRLGPLNVSLLSMATFKGDCRLIKFLVDNGCDPTSRIGKQGETVMHSLCSDYMFGKDGRLQLEMADILLSACSANVVEAVFANANSRKMTPFLLACDSEKCDQLVLRFLTLLDRNDRSIDRSINRFIGFNGNNAFHCFLRTCNNFLPPKRLETARALIDRIPFSDQLIDAKNDDGETPLYRLIVPNDMKGSRLVADLAQIFFRRGASPDILDRNGWTYLDWAVAVDNVWLIEILLRVGCQTRTSKNGSPLANVLSQRWEKAKMIRVVELFLAFGVDLQKELYLYTIDERSIEFPFDFIPFPMPVCPRRCDPSKMDRDILEALRDLRRSNKMLSLQRQCRNAVRRRLKGKADEAIGNLTCIPDHIKSYLLVDNERPILHIKH